MSSELVELTIMIPAYLEGANLPGLLPQMKVAAAALPSRYEILIVDTETDMDDTVAVCSAHSARQINRSGGNQYGDAIRTGIR